MKWTKFKDQIPKKTIIYVTDWTSVWTSDGFACTSVGDRWDEYGQHNPEYGWAEIPIPEVPEEPGDLHRCQFGSWVCEGPTDGSFIYGFEGMSISSIVGFCPICGQEAKKKDQ